MFEKLVLLVEENPDDEELTHLAFLQRNFPNRVIEARVGMEALDYLNNCETNQCVGECSIPKLIQLDMK